MSGIALSYYYYVVNPDDAGDARSAAFKPLYTLFYNKWYFDELYDAVFVQPALAIGRLFWKKGDGATIDGLGPDGIAARRSGPRGRAEPVPERVPLPLCLRDADRRCRASSATSCCS